MFCRLFLTVIAVLLNIALATVNPELTAQIMKAAQEDNTEQVRTLLAEFQDINYVHARRMAFKFKEGQILNQLNADRSTGLKQSQPLERNRNNKKAQKGLLRQLRAERRLLIAVQEAKYKQVLKVAHIAPQKIIEIHLKYSSDQLRRTGNDRYAKIIQILLQRIYQKFECGKCLNDVAAAKGDYYFITSLLIAKGTTVRVDHLYSAVKNSNPKALQVLLMNIHDGNVFKHDRILLRTAALSGHRDIVRILLNVGMIVTRDNLNILNYRTKEIYRMLKEKYDEQVGIDKTKTEGWLEGLRPSKCFGASCKQ